MLLESSKKKRKQLLISQMNNFIKIITIVNVFKMLSFVYLLTIHHHWLKSREKKRNTFTMICQYIFLSSKNGVRLWISIINCVCLFANLSYFVWLLFNSFNNGKLLIQHQQKQNKTKHKLLSIWIWKFINRV